MARPGLDAREPAVLEGIPIEGVGVAGLLVLLFVMLATGRLVTRREAQGVEKDRDAWRDLALEQKGLLSQLLVGQETANRILSALPHAEDTT